MCSNFLPSSLKSYMYNKLNLRLDFHENRTGEIFQQRLNVFRTQKNGKRTTWSFLVTTIYFEFISYIKTRISKKKKKTINQVKCSKNIGQNFLKMTWRFSSRLNTEFKYVFRSCTVFSRCIDRMTEKKKWIVFRRKTGRCKFILQPRRYVVEYCTRDVVFNIE